VSCPETAWGTVRKPESISRNRPGGAKQANMNDFDASTLTSFYPDAGETARNVAVAVPDDLRHVRRVTSRTVKEQLRIANAAKHLDKLPEPGETLHLVCRGNFAAWDFVPAI